jgi:phosphatidylinositol dimannoside acyltransferase
MSHGGREPSRCPAPAAVRATAGAGSAGGRASAGRAVAEAGTPPPHAPETGLARRLLGRLHVTGVFWFRLHGWGAQHWPSVVMWIPVTFFTTFFFLTLVNIRRAVAQNLVAVLGPGGWARRQARIYKTFWNFAWCLTERYERLVSKRPFKFSAAEPEGWAELWSSGQGFVAVTAHLGNWEVGSMLPATASPRTVHVMREAETDPRAQQYISELMRRQARAGSYITHFAEDPQLGLLLLDALRCGDLVALQGDRPRAGGRIATVPLFGRPFPLPLGPAVLARAAGVPLVPVFVFREGRRRYRCELCAPIHISAAGDGQASVEEALRRFAGDLERAIASHPHQWFCFRQLWR